MYSSLNFCFQIMFSGLMITFILGVFPVAALLAEQDKNTI